MPEPQIYTYHCICTELVLATFTPLQNLPKRKGDGAKICKITQSDLPIPEAVALSGSTFDESAPTILKLEDGFEKRYHVKCRRCDLKIGYRLDKSQYDEEEDGLHAGVLYLLPGGLMSTDEMTAKKDMDSEIELVASQGG